MAEPGEAEFRGLRAAEAQAWLASIVQSSHDAIVGKSLDGLITSWNPGAEQLYGYTAEELIGRPVEILVPAQKGDVHPGHWARYFAQPDPRPMRAGMQVAARRKNGTEFPAEISMSALETQEGLLVSAAVRDVSERIEAQAERERLKAQAERGRLERRLHQSQRLESLGQLAGGVAHDFNNLLAVILNYAAFVEHAVEDRPDVRADVAEIRRAAEVAASVTQRLLVFSRRDLPHTRILRLDHALADTARVLDRTIGEDIRLETEVDRDLASII